MERTRSNKYGDCGSGIGMFGKQTKTFRTEQPMYNDGGSNPHKNKNSKWCLYKKTEIPSNSIIPKYLLKTLLTYRVFNI